MKTFFLRTTFLLIGIMFFSSCSNDENNTVKQPEISNLEIGLSNSEIGTIGKDFHLEFDILAGDKINDVQIKILPIATETYSKVWSHEIVWKQYKGSKNTNVHKHFDIPTDAPEGKFDFIIIVNDENGSKLEVKKTITLYTETNLPVNPSASIFNVHINGSRFYRNGKFITEGSSIKKEDLFNSQVTINNVKGDGKMYLLLINKKHNHKPESIDKIDFTKAIVYDVVEHKDWTKTDFFSNSTFDPTTNTIIRPMPDFIIGASSDNNLPNPNAINGLKAWESGTYYYGVVYYNSTYKMGFFQYIEIPFVI